MLDSKYVYIGDWTAEGMKGMWQEYGCHDAPWSLEDALAEIEASKQIDQENREFCYYRLTNIRTGATIVV